MSGWSILFWLIITFLLLYPLNRWISAHVQGVAFLLTGSHQVAVWLFWALFLPGTFLHEVSHWLTAVVLGARASKLSIWPKVKRRGELQMGSVQVEVSDPFRHSLIGLAPLVFGSVVVLLIGRRLNLEHLALAFSGGDLEQIWRAINEILAAPDVWLWLYLIFAISNAMLPSASDRESWWSVMLYLSLALLLLIGLGINPAFSSDVQAVALTILSHLFSAFAITLGVDLFFVVVIMILETLLSWMLRRRVQYNS